MRRSVCVLLLALAIFGGLHEISLADVKLPAVLGSHMVLQRDQAVPVWGRAAPGESVTVTFGGKTRKANADEAGRWQVALPKLAASSEPRSMLIEGSGGSRIELTDILVGEVWFCT